MSLRVSQNIPAMSSHRWMQINDSNMAKSIERLSSGFRINSAADDAAGLVISENLRTKVSGLKVASGNTQDAVNMFKTAEKALDEIEVQLRNVRDLTLHAAAQNNNAAAKAADQSQVNQALDAIDRIAEQTEFAGMKLLDTGSNIDGKWFQVGAEATQNVTFNTGQSYDGITVTADMTTGSLLGTGTASVADALSGTNFDGTSNSTDKISVTWTHPNGTTTTADLSISITAGDADTDEVDAINTALGGVNYTSASDPTVNKLDDVMEAYASGGKIGIRLKDVFATQGEKTSSSSLKVVSSNDQGEGSGFGVPGTTDAGAAGAGTVDIESISTSTDYDAVVNKLDDALRMVNGLRVNLGAFQKNNLESNMASIAVAKENLSATESAIRDTDMADEMVSFTKAQILSQASQAMMSQANQAPQNILQMLR